MSPVQGEPLIYIKSRALCASFVGSEDRTEASILCPCRNGSLDERFSRLEILYCSLYGVCCCALSPIVLLSFKLKMTSDRC